MWQELIDDDGVDDDGPADVAVLFHRLFAERRPKWHSRAACRGLGPELMFDRKGTSTARAVCESCPVREECLDSGMVPSNRRDGIWGGLSPIERRRLSVARRDAEREAS